MSEEHPEHSGGADVRSRLEALSLAEAEQLAASRQLAAAQERCVHAALTLEAARVAADAVRPVERVTAYLIADKRRTMDMVVLRREAERMWCRESGKSGPVWAFYRKGLRWVGFSWRLTRESIDALPPLRPGGEP